MVHSLRLEPFRELVDLVVVHLQGPRFGDLTLDVINSLLETTLANFGTAAKTHLRLSFEQAAEII